MGVDGGRSPSPGPRLLSNVLSRATVVFVTSGGMYTQALPLDDPSYSSGDFKGSIAYSRAKRAQVDLVAEYERRLLPGANTTVVAVHPGWADTPGVVESLPTFHLVLGPVLRSPAEGVDTVVWAVGSGERLKTGPALLRSPGAWGQPLARHGDFRSDRATLWDLVERQCGLT